MPNLNKTFDIIGGTEKSEYSIFSPQLIVNMFMVFHSEGLQKKALFPTEGLSLDNGLIFNVGGENRGVRQTYYFNEIMFVIIKDTIFRVTANYINSKPTFSHSIIGVIDTQTGYVGIADNGTQIIFVDGIKGYLYDSISDNFSVITSPGFPTSPTDIAILGNRFIANKGETKESFFSAQGDGLSWGLNDFFSMTSYPDIVVAYSTLNGQLYVMGRKSTEIWYEVSSPTLPYRPQKPTLEFGCSAIGSVAIGFGMMIWLSRTNRGVGSILMTTGSNPVPISNEAIDTMLDTYTAIEDATSYLFKNDVGHVMYVINFTIDDVSWMFDFNTKRWSRLESNDSNRYTGNTYQYYKSHHYIFDYQNPHMYEMSKDYFDEAGKAIKRQVISPVFMNPNQVSLNEFQVFLKQGTGKENGNDEDPYLMLSVSYDGGLRYGNDRKSEIGKIGESLTQTVWNTLGIANSFVFKLEHYNRTPCVILGAMGNVGEG